MGGWLIIVTWSLKHSMDMSQNMRQNIDMHELGASKEDDAEYKKFSQKLT